MKSWLLNSTMGRWYKMFSPKKLLDKTPRSVYNIFKDGEGFDLSSINKGTRLAETLYYYYTLVLDTYTANPSLFPTPPVFAGGFFRDILWGNDLPDDLDLFFNSYGMEKEEAEDNLCLFLNKLGLTFTGQDGSYGTNDPGSFRVSNVTTGNMALRCPLQVILKDMGPSEDDPLYVTKIFHYNHAKAALSVAGPPAIRDNDLRLNLFQAQAVVNQQRNEFVNQFDPL